MCIAAAIGLTFVPGLGTRVLEAANRLSFQPGYLHVVYTGATPALPLPSDMNQSLGSSALRGCLATIGAILLALSSVFRSSLTQRLRVGAYLEGPLTWLRAIQSGHVGDYVLWLTMGSATLGLGYFILLR